MWYAVKKERNERIRYRARKPVHEGEKNVGCTRGEQEQCKKGRNDLSRGLERQSEKKSLNHGSDNEGIIETEMQRGLKESVFDL